MSLFEVQTLNPSKWQIFLFQSLHIAYIWIIYFRIRGYGVVNLNDSILIIGGKCDSDSEIAGSQSRIAKYKLTRTVEEWSQVGNLQKPRDYHRAMINGNLIYVVGGRYEGHEGHDNIL